MVKTIIYKCDKCGAVFVTKTSKPSFPVRCVKCQIIMRELDEDFDLSEIIEEEK